MYMYVMCTRFIAIIIVYMQQQFHELKNKNRTNNLLWNVLYFYSCDSS